MFGALVIVFREVIEAGLIIGIVLAATRGISGRGHWVAAARAARGATADAAYARGVRARTKLTQAQFAARIGVPIETVRNWEQGKRSPRGPARALLKVIDEVPEVAFAVLSAAKPQT